MALNKVNYIDNETIITAENLNNIQDEIIANANANPYIGYVDNIFAVNENCICKYDANTLNSPYTAGLTSVGDGICIISIAGDYASYICHPTSVITTFRATRGPGGYSAWYNQDLENNYPVGSIYLSVNSNSPAYLFGGTWEQIVDKFLLGAGNSYALGATGGEATHTLTVAEMPSHVHNLQRDMYGVQMGIAGGSHYPGNAITGQYSEVTIFNNSIGAGPTGGSKSHNNMPPYYAVYIWKRVA